MDVAKLEQLFIGEISSVDDPANQIPGWMVQKATGSQDGDGAAPNAAPSIVERLKAAAFSSTGKDADDMTADELKAILDERDPALVEKVAEIVAKSIAPADAGASADGTPAAPPAPVEKSAEQIEAETAATAEALAKAVQEALAPYHQILEEGLLPRMEAIETALGIASRKSLVGQETVGDAGAGAGETKAPTFGDALSSLAKSAREGRYGRLGSVAGA